MKYNLCSRHNRQRIFSEQKNGRINRGSYMSAHVLLNLLNKLGNGDKM